MSKSVPRVADTIHIKQQICLENAKLHRQNSHPPLVSEKCAISCQIERFFQISTPA